MEEENGQTRDFLRMNDLKSASCTDLPLPNFDLLFNCPQKPISSDCEFSPIPIASERGPFKYIDKETMANCLENPLITNIDKIIYFDCRFPYQYQHAHIVGSINLVTFKQMTILYHSLQKFKCCFIFYDSDYKASQWIKLFRNYDRSMNMGKTIPYSYPNIFLLNSSFDTFQKQYPQLVLINHRQDMANDYSVVEKHKKEYRQYREEMKNLDKLFFSKPSIHSLITTTSFPCYNSLYKSNSKP